MTEKPENDRIYWFLLFPTGAIALVGVCLGVWLWFNVRERARLREEFHQGLEGVWIDDSGRDVSYQLREDGVLLVRQKLPSNFAPFSGDPGVEHQPCGKWSRKGSSVSVQAEPHWGFELVLGEDGQLRGTHFLDSWSGQGEYSRSETPVVLRRKPRP